MWYIICQSLRQYTLTFESSSSSELYWDQTWHWSLSSKFIRTLISQSRTCRTACLSTNRALCLDQVLQSAIMFWTSRRFILLVFSMVRSLRTPIASSRFADYFIIIALKFNRCMCNRLIMRLGLIHSTIFYLETSYYVSRTRFKVTVIVLLATSGFFKCLRHQVVGSFTS